MSEPDHTSFPEVPIQANCPGLVKGVVLAIPFGQIAHSPSSALERRRYHNTAT